MDSDNNESKQNDVLLIAKRQQVLLIIFFIYILASGASALVSPEIKVVVQLSLLPIMLLIIIFTARLSFKVFRKVGATILTILSIIPIVNFIVVLIVNSKASKIIKANGFRVGLIGANIKEISKSI